MLASVLSLCLFLVGQAFSPARLAAAEPTPAKRQLTLGPAIITTGPALPISAVAFAPDSKTLVVGGYQEVLLWDLQNAQLAKRAGTGQLTGQVRAIAYSKDGKLLAAADGPVRLLDPATGQVTATLGESKDETFALAFSPDGTLLASGGADAIVRIWTLNAPTKPIELKAHTDWITALAFSPNGKLLASGSTDKTVQAWDTAEWKPIVSLPQTVTEPVSGVAFSPDGTTLNFAVAGPDERAIRVWRPDVLDQKEVNGRKPNIKFTRPTDTGSCLAQSLNWAGGPRPRMLLSCTDKTARAMNVNGGVLATMSGHQDWVYTLVANADGSRLASGSADGTVRIWNGDHTPMAVLVQLRPRADEWLILTPSGYFSTSNRTAIEMKNADTLENPQVVRDILAGKPAPKKK